MLAVAKPVPGLGFVAQRAWRALWFAGVYWHSYGGAWGGRDGMDATRAISGCSAAGHRERGALVVLVAVHVTAVC